jgi:diguanylate cyclase (GGDEF)-like protein
VSDLSEARFVALQPSATAPPAMVLAMVNSLPDAVWLVDAKTLEIVVVNAAAAEMLGASASELLGLRMTSLACTPEDFCFWDAALQGPALASNEQLMSDTWLRRANRGEDGCGTETLAVTRQISLLQCDGASPYYLVVVKDRSAQMRIEDELELRIAELAATLESTADGILVLDLNGRIRNFNQKFSQLWNLPGELLSRRDDEAMLDWMRRSVVEPHSYVRRLNSICEDVGLQGSDTLNLHGGRVLERTTLPQCSRGRPIGRVFSFRDITEQVEAARRIDTLSQTDALTGLPNLRVLSDRVDFALAMAQRDGTPFALLFVNLDRFNHVNETLGHGFGDRVLTQAAGRLKGCLRQVDTVARLGGDEFVLLVHQADAGGAAVAARRAIEAMQEPFTLDAMQFNVTCSIGIALYPNDGASMDELLRHADASMHEAKAAGRGNFRFHRHQPQGEEGQRLTRLRLDHAMRQALALGRFRLHYQPQIDMHSGDVVGAEALIRWNDPELGSVSPADFIPVAEETGFIVAIGDWVMREAIQQAARWHSEGKRISISVNVSALQFQQPEFVDEVAKALTKHQLCAEYLELELTESILIQNAEEALQRLGQLAALGVKLAIDDFGTGYSSLGYLKRFPIGRLKIDRSFVRGLPGDESDAGIVNAIVNLGHALHMQIVAEGVETEAQRVFLQSLGCGQYQGFLFAPALDALTFDARLTSHAAQSAGGSGSAHVRLVHG